MKTAVFFLFLISTFLGYKILSLEAELRQISTNTAIAVLSAEAANNKIGAIAPYFTHDKEKFINAWIDNTNMPLAIFPDEVLVPLKRELEAKRTSIETVQLKAAVFK